MPTTLPADTAQYFYDELGRLAGVIDGQGQVAVYTYDAVGNLLSIQRFTTSGVGVGMFAVAPRQRTRKHGGDHSRLRLYGSAFEQSGVV
jgi:YD repeat-containing protein